jgi:hypothetical protein
LRLSLIAGVASGTVIAAAIWPLWSGFGPIAALAGAVLVGALGAVIATLLE